MIGNGVIPSLPILHVLRLGTLQILFDGVKGILEVSDGRFEGDLALLSISILLLQVVLKVLDALSVLFILLLQVVLKVLDALSVLFVLLLQIVLKVLDALSILFVLLLQCALKLGNLRLLCIDILLEVLDPASDVTDLLLDAAHKLAEGPDGLPLLLICHI